MMKFKQKSIRGEVYLQKKDDHHDFISSKTQNLPTASSPLFIDKGASNTTNVLERLEDHTKLFTLFYGAIKLLCKPGGSNLNTFLLLVIKIIVEYLSLQHLYTLSTLYWKYIYAKIYS